MTTHGAGATMPDPTALRSDETTPDPTALRSDATTAVPSARSIVGGP
jgi:hypothetical protein